MFNERDLNLVEFALNNLILLMEHEGEIDESDPHDWEELESLRDLLEIPHLETPGLLGEYEIDVLLIALDIFKERARGEDGVTVSLNHDAILFVTEEIEQVRNHIVSTLRPM